MFNVSCCVHIVAAAAGLCVPSCAQPRNDRDDKNDQNTSSGTSIPVSNPVSAPLEPWEDPTVVYISNRLADLRRPVGPNDGLPALRALRNKSLMSLEGARLLYRNHYESPLYVDTNNNRQVFRHHYQVFPPMHRGNDDASSAARLYDKQGYYKGGYDAYGYDAYGYNREGYDKEGYDREGFDRRGYNRQGLDRAQVKQWLKGSRHQK